jgi:acyl carrier protein
MDNLDVRLKSVFRAVFPDMRDADSVSNWDSVASVTLYTLVEEEFGAEFDLAEVAEWTSFQEVRASVEKRFGG